LGNSNQFGHGYKVLHSFPTVAPNIVKTQSIDKNILDFVLGLSLLTVEDYDWWTQLNFSHTQFDINSWQQDFWSLPARTSSSPAILD
jgi:hypothetical protein